MEKSGSLSYYIKIDTMKGLIGDMGDYNDDVKPIAITQVIG